MSASAATVAKPKRRHTWTPPKPGERRGGRVKGTPNKVTADVRQMVLEALSMAGGAEYLLNQAFENPAAFMTLVGKVLPLQVNANVDATTSYVIRAPTPIEDAQSWLAAHAPSDRREPVLIDAQPERETEGKD